MREMSSRQASDFLDSLNSQAELKLQAYIAAPQGSSYKDEVRAEAETYGRIIKDFSHHLQLSISKGNNLAGGLTAEQAIGFLNFLDQEILALKTWLEENRRKQQAALSNVPEPEYIRTKNIYKEMRHRVERQMFAFEDSRAMFIKVLETE